LATELTMKKRKKMKLPRWTNKATRYPKRRLLTAATKVTLTRLKKISRTAARPIIPSPTQFRSKSKNNLS